jgi:hypothetical protein
MSPLFSITVECDDKGRITIWAQQKEKLSPDNLEKLSQMLLSVKKSMNQYTIKNELQFEVNEKGK